jgi:hypothetical protein
MKPPCEVSRTTEPMPFLKKKIQNYLLVFPLGMELFVKTKTKIKLQ